VPGNPHVALLIMQNRGKLAGGKRWLFPELRNEEIVAMEEAVRNCAEPEQGNSQNIQLSALRPPTEHAPEPHTRLGAKECSGIGVVSGRPAKFGDTARQIESADYDPALVRDAVLIGLRC
jgi:hypothetical protein